MFVLIIFAQAPTTDWIGNTMRLMLIDDHFSLTLQGGRTSVDQALNEVLWKDTPIQQAIGRWPLQDYELGGQRIGRGDMLVLGLASANADPQVRPGSFGNMGANRAHMSFSHGEHACPVGAPEIAEGIARTAVEVLLDRIPDVELAVPADLLRWKETSIMRGLESLPVTFTPTAAR
jgi:cytochrome P450